ncbi:S8 family serine peptidase [Pontibacillus sp. HMF3514]|uniref:S8 family peptidase n=1 Tax=Pontibacillus sp. HMF3514 TaxID=2692425 RepID=UPI001320064A|nr:S8 family serine peptidase [Pontibacillus sp. HMF3514]QHE51712.1 S8 family serine peptidase [Pontibacillus sp. HMF3514]
MKFFIKVSIALLVLFSFGSSYLHSTKANATSLEVGDALKEVLSSESSDFIVEAVITYDQMPSESDLDALQNLGLDTKTYSKLPMVAITGTNSQVNDLLDQGLNARSIYYNKKLDYFMKDSRKLVGAERVWNDLGYTGKGTTIAVVDSGIDATHQDLPYGDKVIQNVKFLVGDSIFGDESLYLEDVVNTDTSSGHGTHVAGTIAGNGTASDGLYAGIAPDAQLVGLGTGEGINILWSLEAFNYVLEHHEEYGIDVVSNSWGTTGDYSPNNPINVASKKLHDAGMVVTFAAGNEGPENNTLNPYSAAPWVISVAAGTKDKQLADFSSRGIPGDEFVHPDITAPGVDIVSTKSSTGLVMNSLGTTTDVNYIEEQYLPYYTTASGTSMATPHISGIVALMREAQPDLHPDAVLDIMEKTAEPMSGYELHEVGKGYVDAYAAVEQASKTKATTGQYKDKETGKTYETYFVTETWNSSIGPGAADADAASHDYYTINLGKDTVSLNVKIEWVSPTNDLDLEVRDPNGDLAGSSGNAATTVEETFIPNTIEGDYTVDVIGYLNTTEQYTGTYTIERILK